MHLRVAVCTCASVRAFILQVAFHFGKVAGGVEVAAPLGQLY